MKVLPDIHTQFQDWYNEIVYQAELADQSPVRGSMVIRPYGYAIWEHITAILDKRIKETGHQNAAFPLLIPESFLKREAEHIKGFAPELAVVTYAGGKELEEPLVVRPTSETIIHYMFARWIKSWRDLPLKINQWANIVRWEMRTKAFLRTTEFFWQEGHTAHATHDEALDEVMMMLGEYVKLAQNILAVPVVTGLKTETEKFPGAEKTFTFEAFMPDGRALQMGTSHLLSQNFAKAFEMKYQDKQGDLVYPYLTSWGVTTRLIGATVMIHGDQNGLVLPPMVAPIQVVVVPIIKKSDTSHMRAIVKAVSSLTAKLKRAGIRVYVDDDDTKTPGSKFHHWELKGVPLRIEIGPRDITEKSVMVVDRLDLKRVSVAVTDAVSFIRSALDSLQKEMFERALQRQKKMWHSVESLDDLGKAISQRIGFYQTGWCGDAACEAQLKNYQATIRCLIDQKIKERCFSCSRLSKQDVLVAKSY